MEKITEFFKKIWEKFKSFGKGIKIAIIVALIAVIVAIISTIVMSSANKYAVLFSNLDANDAETVTAKLTDEKVDMKVQGNSILVPTADVDKLRMELASSITSGSKGYELMDTQSSFGMTDAQFNLQKQRMLQGELEKAIKSLEPVQTAKVLITPATDSAFVKDKQAGKAAVVVQLKPGYKITDDQVQAIVALVSASTDDIPKENIEVTDTKMNLLTKNESDSSSVASGTFSASSTDKNKAQEQAYEQKLSSNIVSLLEPIVGQGKVKAEVSADMNFDSKKITQTQIDPSKALISQDITREYSNSNGGSTSASPVDNNMSNTIATDTVTYGTNKDQQVNNYDHSKTETQTIAAPGEVKRLTASVIVDGTLDDATQTAFENAVKAAIGFDTERKDSLSVVGMSFDPAIDQAKQDQIDALNQQTAAENRNKLIIYGIIGGIVLVAIILAIVLLLRRRSKEDERLLDVTLGEDFAEETPEPVKYEPLKLEPEQSENQFKESEIKKYAKDKPEQVADIIKSWLSDNER